MYMYTHMYIHMYMYMYMHVVVFRAALTNAWNSPSASDTLYLLKVHYHYTTEWNNHVTYMYLRIEVLN